MEVRVGAAIDTLPELEKDGSAPFDLIFIDADKPGNPEYFQWAMKLSRPGTTISLLRYATTRTSPSACER